MRPRPRAILNSSSPPAFASRINPRSAPVASIAESTTSSSTSSRTREGPNARRLSSKDEICLKPRTPEECVPWESVVSPRRKTSSVLSLLPSRMRSRCSSGRSVTGSLFTNVPDREPRSLRTYAPSSRRLISACSRETSTSTERTSLSVRRPSWNTGLSMSTTRRPSGLLTSSRGCAREGTSLALTGAVPSGRRALRVGFDDPGARHLVADPAALCVGEHQDDLDNPDHQRKQEQRDSKRNTDQSHEQ